MQSLTHQIDDDRIPEEKREAKQHPRKVRRLKGEEAEEVHADVRVASAPDVHQHYGERLAEKHQAYKHCYELLSPVNEKTNVEQFTMSTSKRKPDIAYFYLVSLWQLKDKNVNYCIRVSGVPVHLITL